MTTRERLKQMLESNGMFPDQAEAVLAEAIPEIESLTSDYRPTWNRPAHEYPDAVYEVMWLVVKRVALKWIDVNAPKAWFRPLFEM